MREGRRERGREGRREEREEGKKCEFYVRYLRGKE